MSSTMTIDDSLVSELDGITDAGELVAEVFHRFGDRAAVGTSGQLTGCVLVDLAAKCGEPYRVFVVDALRLLPETYEHWDRLEEHYGIELERFKPDPEKVERMVNQHGEFLFFDSKTKQEYCCNIRKVEPNEKALETVDAWITGLRRDQSDSRAGTPRIEIDSSHDHPILKLCPLADWNEERVWDYLEANQVPVNPLFQRNLKGAQFKSLGCVICTTPVLPHESPRAGRWRWFNSQEGDDQKECGIHINE